MLRPTILVPRASTSPLTTPAYARLNLTRCGLATRSRDAQARNLGFTRSLTTSRCLCLDAAPAAANPTPISKTSPNANAAAQDTEYSGPLSPTFRRLKIFSLSSLGLSTTLAPFMFLVESNLPFSARIALAGIAIGTSGLSTGLVGWCGKPYVTALKRMKSEGGEIQGLELTTLTLTLQPRITKVYDSDFLVETKRPFAKWELAEKLVLPSSRSATPGHEETIAETYDKDSTVLGRWVVTWGEGGEGNCREVGSVNRHFNVHEELLQ